MQRRTDNGGPRRKFGRPTKAHRRSEKERRIKLSQPLIDQLKARGVRIISFSPTSKRLLTAKYGEQYLIFEHPAQIKNFLSGFET